MQKAIRVPHDENVKYMAFVVRRDSHKLAQIMTGEKFIETVSV